MSMQRLWLVVLASWLHLLGGSAYAQTGPVRLVIGFAPGGATDLLARVIAAELSTRSGSTVIVENKPGAGGVLAADFVARSPADGRTFLVGSGAVFVVNPLLVANLPFNADRDLLPVAGLSKSPMLMVVKSQLPVTSARELLSLAKSKADRPLTMGTSGNGSAQHLLSAHLASLTDTKFLTIPYKGDAAALTALMGGDIDIFFPSISSGIAAVKSARVRPLAVMDDRRYPDLPDVPTASEAGIVNADLSAWFGLFAPAGTQAEVVSRTASQVLAVLGSEEVRSKLRTIGMVPLPLGAAELGQFIQREKSVWQPVIRSLGLKPE